MFFQQAESFLIRDQLEFIVIQNIQIEAKTASIRDEEDEDLSWERHLLPLIYDEKHNLMQ